MRPPRRLLDRGRGGRAGPRSGKRAGRGAAGAARGDRVGVVARRPATATAYRGRAVPAAAGAGRAEGLEAPAARGAAGAEGAGGGARGGAAGPAFNPGGDGRRLERPARRGHGGLARPRDARGDSRPRAGVPRALLGAAERPAPRASLGAAPGRRRGVTRSARSRHRHACFSRISSRTEGGKRTAPWACPERTCPDEAGGAVTERTGDGYGQMLLDAFEGKRAVEIVERDDGFISASVGGPPLYLAPFRRWPALHRRAM